MENLDCFGVSILIPSGKGMRSVGCLCELLKQYVMSNNFPKNICCVVQRSKVSWHLHSIAFLLAIKRF